MKIRFDKGCFEANNPIMAVAWATKLRGLTWADIERYEREDRPIEVRSTTHSFGFHLFRVKEVDIDADAVCLRYDGFVT